MRAILRQIAMAFGAVLFVIVVGIGLTRGIPVTVILFRGLIVMSLGTVAAMIFFRFFQGLLYRFVAEQVMMQGRAARLEASKNMPGGIGAAMEEKTEKK